MKSPPPPIPCHSPRGVGVVSKTESTVFPFAKKKWKGLAAAIRAERKGEGRLGWGPSSPHRRIESLFTGADSSATLMHYHPRDPELGHYKGTHL